MLDSASIIAFAATSNAEAAKQFYRDILQLKLVADEPFAVVFDANGTMLRLQKVEKVTAVPYTTLGWKVADVEAVVDALAAAGVASERYPNFGQDDKGIVTFPDGARVAWFKDPDGNLLSLTQK